MGCKKAAHISQKKSNINQEFNICACAEATRAIGTRNGEQLT